MADEEVVYGEWDDGISGRRLPRQQQIRNDELMFYLYLYLCYLLVRSPCVATEKQYVNEEYKKKILYF